MDSSSFGPLAIEGINIIVVKLSIACTRWGTFMVITQDLETPSALVTTEQNVAKQSLKKKIGALDSLLKNRDKIDYMSRTVGTKPRGRINNI